MPCAHHPAWVERLLTNSAQYATLLRPTFAGDDPVRGEQSGGGEIVPLDGGVATVERCCAFARAGRRPGGGPADIDLGRRLGSVPCPIPVTRKSPHISRNIPPPGRPLGRREIRSIAGAYHRPGSQATPARAETQDGGEISILIIPEIGLFDHAGDETRRIAHREVQPLILW